MFLGPGSTWRLPRSGRYRIQQCAFLWRCYSMRCQRGAAWNWAGLQSPIFSGPRTEFSSRFCFALSAATGSAILRDRWRPTFLHMYTLGFPQVNSLFSLRPIRLKFCLPRCFSPLQMLRNPISAACPSWGGFFFPVFCLRRLCRRRWSNCPWPFGRSRPASCR